MVTSYSITIIVQRLLYIKCDLHIPAVQRKSYFIDNTATKTNNTDILSLLSSIPHHSTYMKRKYVSNVEFARQTNTDTKSLQCPSLFFVPIERKKDTHIFKVFRLNPTSLNIYGEDKCSMLSLHDKPTLTPKVFNAIQCFTYHLKFLGSIPHH